MHVLHGGDSRLDHLKSGVERVEVEIDGARRHAADDPHFQLTVGRAELEGSQPDMVMGIHEPRQNDTIGIADDLVWGIFPCKLAKLADVHDGALRLEHSPIFYDEGLWLVARMTDDVSASN
jgi:hypothetical protein